MTASILRTLYQTGLKIADAVFETICCQAAKLLPAWNYRIEPTPA